MLTDVLDGLIGDTGSLTRVVRTATGRPGDVQVLEVDRDPVPLSNMTTAALARVRGTVTADSDPQEWSLVVKVVQSPEHSALWERIPEPFRDGARRDLPWRSEPELYRSSIRHRLPHGVRLPAVHAVEEIGETRLAIWMEDVPHVDGPWSMSDYRRAGRALGRMAGRFPEGTLPDDLELARRDLRGYLFGRVTAGVMPALSADETWTHPLVAGVVDPSLRTDLVDLRELAPTILDRLDVLPRTVAHGDACPQNLLRCANDAGTLVAIDWQFVGLCAAGFDCGQLLAGHAESGDLEPHQLEPVLTAVIEEYAAGMRDEGMTIDDADVYLGAVGALVIRSGFTAIPLELLDAGDTAEVRRLFRLRAGYARFLVDLASTLGLPG